MRYERMAQVRHSFLYVLLGIVAHYAYRALTLHDSILQRDETRDVWRLKNVPTVFYR
jgi:hypothetical protein